MPLHEAESRIKRLEDLFAMADSQVSVAVANVLRGQSLARRQQQKAVGAIHGTLDGSLTLARPQVAALLRLAYLRAARERLGQSFRLSETHEGYVEDVVTYVMIQLTDGADCIYHKAISAMRQQLLRQWDRSEKIPSRPISLPLTFRSTNGNMWTLQDYAGVVVRTTIETLIESAVHAEELDPEYAA